MNNRHNSRSYTIAMEYGEADLNQLIDDFAKQIIHQYSGDFGMANLRKKSLLVDKLHHSICGITAVSI